jgi:GTP pyrophosphokinase
MKTNLQDSRAAIVQLTESEPSSTAQHDASQLARARAFSEPLLEGRLLGTGENALVHADCVAAILESLGAALKR